MTRMEVMVMLSESGVQAKFTDADKAFEIIEGKIPEAYLVPQWFYTLIELLQEGKPRWSGKRLDPWAKDEIRGQ